MHRMTSLSSQQSLSAYPHSQALDKNRGGAPGIHARVCASSSATFSVKFIEIRNLNLQITRRSKIYDCNVQLHHVETQAICLPLLPFQSGCEARVQNSYITCTRRICRQPYKQSLPQLQTCCIAISCSSFSAILGFPTLPRARISLNHRMYGRATRTGIAVVYKKSLGSRACANSGD